MHFSQGVANGDAGALFGGSDHARGVDRDTTDAGAEGAGDVAGDLGASRCYEQRAEGKGEESEAGRTTQSVGTCIPARSVGTRSAQGGGTANETGHGSTSLFWTGEWSSRVKARP